MTQTKCQATPKVTVAWCPACKMQTVGIGDIGIPCWNECERTLVKRVGYICREQTVPFGYNMWMPCQMFHRTVRAMKECAHDAY